MTTDNTHIDFKKIFISIILPTYNGANTIEDAIRSVLEQTFQYYELIIVDDGSTDNTKEIVSHYISAYSNKIKYIYKTNGGVASARNEGIIHAKGNYIAFLDSDDYWDAQKLKKISHFIMHYPQVGLFYTDFYVVDIKKNILWINDRFSFSGDIFSKLIERNFIGTSTVVVKKEAFENVSMFFEGYRMKAGPEDWDMWLRIARKYKVFHIPEKLSYYRYREGQYKYKKEFFDDYETLLDRFLTNAQDINKKKVYALYYYSRGKSYLIDGKQYARKEFLQSIKLDKFSIKSYILFLISFLPKNVIKCLKYKLKIA